MRSKRKIFLTVLISLLIVLFVCRESCAETENAETVNTETPNVIPLNIEPEGEVVVRPYFGWTGEEGTGFRLEFSIANESNMTIPETQLSFSLSEKSGCSFLGDHGTADGIFPPSYSMDVSRKEHTEILLRIPSFAPGEKYSFYADGVRKESEEPGNEPEKNIKPGDMKVILTLKGSEKSGLVHVAKETLAIPAPAVPEEKPVVLPLYKSVLIVNLNGTGKQPVSAERISGISEMKSAGPAENILSGKYLLGFWDRERAAEMAGKITWREYFRKLWPLFVSVLVMILINKMIIYYRIRRKERQKKFDPRNGLNHVTLTKI